MAPKFKKDTNSKKRQSKQINSSSTGNLSGTSPSLVVVPVICAGHCNKAFSSENDRMVECERCTQFTCIECLGISKEQYSFIEDWCTILCNNCRPLANKEMKEGRSVEIQCKDFLVQHNQKMVELELKINLKPDKSVVDTLESNQHSTNAKMEGLAYDISNLNKKIELMLTQEEAKAERARNVVFRGVPEAADTKKTILNIFEYLKVETEPEYIGRMGAPRKDGSGRPIKVVLKEVNEQNQVLKNKTSIRGMVVPESENYDPLKIFITEDQTILERDNKLRGMLKERREKEPDFRWMIYRGRVKKYLTREQDQGVKALNVDREVQGARAQEQRVHAASAAESM